MHVQLPASLVLSVPWRGAGLGDVPGCSAKASCSICHEYTAVRYPKPARCCGKWSNRLRGYYRNPSSVSHRCSTREPTFLPGRYCVTECPFYKQKIHDHEALLSDPHHATPANCAHLRGPRPRTRCGTHSFRSTPPRSSRTPRARSRPSASRSPRSSSPFLPSSVRDVGRRW